jgi:hypothetical protein
MTQARISIGYSDEEWHPTVRRCRQALHQDPEFFRESFGAKPSGPAWIGRISCHRRLKSRFPSQLSLRPWTYWRFLLMIVLVRQLDSREETGAFYDLSAILSTI